MFGLGKKRSKLGKFIDKHSITTTEFSKACGVSRKTIGIVCNDKNYIPRQDIIKKILKTVRRIDSSAKINDFWDI
ncbi:transcriptional regulator [Priestia megaterium]|uniref:helix-turn-helix domain-containing protein n=1 Tax=Priestia megaterium TaxID=1404 RepID=UPI0026E1270A|nr:helix-turn-helix domain-containing protein [Priestia megaterium]MDO6851756.1 transcriptional regulator [Priestia megaterium]